MRSPKGSGSPPAAAAGRNDAEGADRRWAWLRSQGLGFVCGQATVVLLAIGSFALSHADAGAAAPRMDDVTVFFDHPSPRHLWFYALIPVMTLYALNTVLCTWHEVSRKWRQGRRAPSAYAAAVIHVAFLLALVAHAVGGMWSEEGQPILVTGAWTDLGGGEEARVVALDEETHPDGSLKQVHAKVQVRPRGGGAAREVDVGWNHPLAKRWGADLWLLADYGQAPAGPRLVSGDDRCAARPRTECTLGGTRVTVVDVRRQAAWLVAPSGELVVPAGGTRDLPGGGQVSFEPRAVEPAVLLRTRFAPGNPWALAAAALVAAGMVMMWRRWW